MKHVNRKMQGKKIRYTPPIDGSIFPDIISFRFVQGAPRIFLAFEMVLAVLVVFGTFILVVLHCVSIK